MFGSKDRDQVSLALTLASASLAVNLVVFATILLLFNLSGLPVSNMDTLTISVTTIEVFLVVVAFGGFWLLRGTVSHQAREETQRQLKLWQADITSAIEMAARETAEVVALRVAEARFARNDEAHNLSPADTAQAFGKDD